MGKGKGQTPRQKAWSKGGLPLVGTAALKHFRAHVLPQLPKCGAKTKSTEDGRPCRQLAMENGRCRYHGGLSPSGSQWRRHQFPKKDGPAAEKKFARKVKQVERDQRDQAKRRRNMTPEQLARHEQWHRDRPVGAPVKRAMRRADRQLAAEIRERMQRDAATPRTVSPEMAKLQDEIDRLEREKARLLGDGETTG